MFILEKPMNHKQIDAYLDALARTRKNDALARKAKKIADIRNKLKK